jgi:uncharacterized protein (TIGR04255 family)
MLACQFGAEPVDRRYQSVANFMAASQCQKSGSIFLSLAYSGCLRSVRECPLTRNRPPSQASLDSMVLECDDDAAVCVAKSKRQVAFYIVETMTSIWDADSLVNARSENVNRYHRSFLKQAVAEFRFPTLMELGARRPPAAFVTALRKEYPTVELQNEVTLTVGGESAGSINKHIFRSRKVGWTVSLKESAFSIETNAYPGFAEMKARVLHVVEAASKVIDSDFFTRVGIRYVNVIDSGTKPEGGGWVNPELVAPLLSSYFKGVQEYAGRIQVGAEDGGCLLQHGIRVKQPPHDLDPEEVWPDYVLDLDVFRNGVSVDDAGQVMEAMHRQAFDAFDWALGPAARDYLSANERSPR